MAEGTAKPQTSVPSGRGVTAAPYDGFAVQRETAPTIKRILAYLVDQGVVAAIAQITFIICVVPLTILGVVGTMLAKSTAEKGILAGVGIFTFVVIILGVLTASSSYYVYQEFKKGSTIGKRLFGLSVVSLDGRRLTMRQCLLRDFMRYFDAMLVIPGLLSLYFSPKRQRLGDLLAGTQVVYSRSSEKANQFMYVAQEDYLTWLAQLQPLPPSAATCRGFMTAQLQTSLGARPSPEVARWCEAAVRHHLPKAAASGLSHEQLWAFFAELCHQSTQAMQRGKAQ